jgi:Methyltransferase domain
METQSGDTLTILCKLLKDRFGTTAIRLYEAGGGSTSWLPKELSESARIVVVDIDETQIRNNTYAHQKILGDIQSTAFPPNSFELIVCYNVIEHLPRPDEAIRLFRGALDRGAASQVFFRASGEIYPALVSRVVLPRHPSLQERWRARRSALPCRISPDCGPRQAPGFLQGAGPRSGRLQLVRKPELPKDPGRMAASREHPPFLQRDPDNARSRPQGSEPWRLSHCVRAACRAACRVTAPSNRSTFPIRPTTGGAR